MFSFARYLFCCAFLLLAMLLNSPAQAGWSLSLPFYTPETSTPADQSGNVPEQQGKAVKPAESDPAKKRPVDSSTLNVTPVSVQLPAAGRAESAQKALSPPRTVSAFFPAKQLGSKTLDEDTEWSGTLRIDGIVTVSPQTTLTVTPGSTIRFAANSGILVYGRIAFKGTPESPIFVSSLYDQPGPSDWSGIYLIGTEKNNIFDHIFIQGADTAILTSFAAFEASGIRIENSATALKILSSTARIRNSAISSATTALLAVKSEVDLDSVTFEKNASALSLQSSSLTAVNVRIRNNANTALIADKSQLKLDRMIFSSNLNGLHTTGCEGSIMNSRFIANKEIAALLIESSLRFSDNHVSGSRVGLQLNDNHPAVWRNSISGNSSYNLLYLGEEQFFAGGNWLGKNLPASRELLVFSKRPEALKTAPLLADDPYPAVRSDITKVAD